MSTTEIVRLPNSGAVMAVEEQVLARMERARQHLAEARTLSDAKKVADGVAAIREWLKRQADAGLAIVNEASLLKLEAEGRMGEFLLQPGSVHDGKGRPRKAYSPDTPSAPTHKQLGITRVAGQKFEAVATVPRDVLRQMAGEATRRGKELTREDVLKVARKLQKRDETTHVVSVEERPLCASSVPEGFRNAVVVGNARELAAGLPDASVAICFCDPVYEQVDDYEWLARECERVLQPGGSLIVQCGNKRRFDCEVAMRRSGLDYVDLLAEVYPFALGRLFKSKVFIGWKPYLWFSRGPRASGWVMNRFGGGGKMLAAESKEIHPWGDSEQFAQALLGKLCNPGDLVWDPFTGSGTVPVVAAKLGLPFVAFEIDPDTALQARQRVGGTRQIASPQQEMDFDQVDEP